MVGEEVAQPTSSACFEMFGDFGNSVFPFQALGCCSHKTGRRKGAAAVRATLRLPPVCPSDSFII